MKTRYISSKRNYLPTPQEGLDGKKREHEADPAPRKKESNHQRHHPHSLSHSLHRDSSNSHPISLHFSQAKIAALYDVLYQKQKSPYRMSIERLSAHEKIRTSTLLKAPAPQAGVSTSFTTCAVNSLQKYQTCLLDANPIQTFCNYFQ